MDWLYPFAILIGIIITLMGLGLPVAFAFFATNILGLILFFLGYTFVFNWAFDRLFGLPLAAQ